MANAPLQAYAGSASCTACHRDEAALKATGMQRAAFRQADPSFQPASRMASFRSGPLVYALTTAQGAVQLSATNGARRSAQHMDWIVGAGGLARTFLYKNDGRWFQSEVSYYSGPQALDITTGFGPSRSEDPIAAIGNLLTPAEARSCFGCHTVHATTTAGLEPLHAEPGIGCEACHGPGLEHVKSMQQKNASVAPGPGSHAGRIYQPAKLSPADSIDFCGACHRSFADASLSVGPQADRAVVRFQPYRLEESKCWRATQDERLTCVACHDPHQPLNRESASYDKNCLQCHSGVTKDHIPDHQAKVCPKATQECVTCHMQKVELASMHGTFSDHFIRIVKKGEPLPR